MVMAGIFPVSAEYGKVNYFSFNFGDNDTMITRFFKKKCQKFVSLHLKFYLCTRFP